MAENTNNSKDPKSQNEKTSETLNEKTENVEEGLKPSSTEDEKNSGRIENYENSQIVEMKNISSQNLDSGNDESNVHRPVDTTEKNDEKTSETLNEKTENVEEGLKPSLTEGDKISGRIENDEDSEQQKSENLSEKEVADLKQKVLENEEKKEFQSEIFGKLKKELENQLSTKNGDKALEGIVVGSMILGSSDMHFEVFEHKVVLRFRIDGILVKVFDIEKKDYKLILEMVKYSSSLKLNITNLPQDGKFSRTIEGKKVDIRVSTLPTKYGENIVCRILDSSKAILDFDSLGFYWTGKRLMERALKQTNGMILVTGPTGSGKTTTLYTMLKFLNTPDKKIITLEDPIEYEMPGVIQSEIHDSDLYNFNVGLKALMRQDPDIIMVGEIRDFETLNTATSASMTGHLVLSTLHTKSAVETLERILNMGLPPFIMASAIDTIIAQRLVRKICPNCKVEKEKSREEITLIKTMLENTGMSSIPTENMKLFHGTGCTRCSFSGYRGRIGIYEIVAMSDGVRELIREGKSTDKILEEARSGDLITMREDGILKALRGYTTIEEVIRVI